jgi:hypothetical protein
MISVEIRKEVTGATVLFCSLDASPSPHETAEYAREDVDGEPLPGPVDSLQIAAHAELQGTEGGGDGGNE